MATGNTQGTRKDLVEGVLDGHNRELRGEALVHIHQLLRCLGLMVLRQCDRAGCCVHVLHVRIVPEQGPQLLSTGCYV